MVGSRNASANAVTFAETLARELTDRGITVVSGLARGIDAACHRGSLEGGTIAVMAGGINEIYPKENARLYKGDIRTGPDHHGNAFWHATDIPALPYPQSLDRFRQPRHRGGGSVVAIRLADHRP